MARKDIFTAFDNATHQHRIGNTGAWAQFLRTHRGYGLDMRFVGEGLWCANHCILLPDEGVDYTNDGHG